MSTPTAFTTSCMHYVLPTLPMKQARNLSLKLQSTRYMEQQCVLMQHDRVLQVIEIELLKEQGFLT